jgi:SAM-dependent methyltransferase
MATSPDYDPTTYQRSADVYDIMNAARGKSYADESATLLRTVRERAAHAESLLDVGCGTGLHLQYLREELRVEGLEPHPRLRAIARERLDDVPVHDGDMRTFDLDRRFDVVTCLFSAIGYMLTIDDLHAAIARMAAHLSPGGVLVVEPWFHAEAWIDGLVIAESATTENVAITRLSHSRRDGDVSHFDFYWTVGRGPTLDGLADGTTPAGHGSVEQWLEPHRLALWSDGQYRDAFTQAGLAVEHDAHGLIGRGLYVGLDLRH